MPRDPADQLAGEMAEGDGVVAVRRAWLPPRGLSCDGVDDRIPVVPVGERSADTRHAALMAEGLGYRDVGLAALGKLGPVVRDRFCVIDQTSVRKHCDHCRNHRLGRREDVDDGVFFPGERLAGIAVSRPDVDYEAPVDRGGEGSPNLVAAGEVGGKCVTHRLKTWGHRAVDVDYGWAGHRAPPRECPRA